MLIRSKIEINDSSCELVNAFGYTQGGKDMEFVCVFKNKRKNMYFTSSMQVHRKDRMESFSLTFDYGFCYLYES